VDPYSLRQAQNPGKPSDLDKYERKDPVNKSPEIEYKEPKKIGIDKVIELTLAFCIAFFALLQWLTTLSNNASTADQSSQLITAAKINAYAAKQNAGAAGNFAVSAQKINQGIGDAVDKLAAQAAEIEASRESSVEESQRSLRTTLRNFQRSERAWVGFTKMDRTIKPEDVLEPTAHFINSGRTPAFDVYAQIEGFPRRVGDFPQPFTAEHSPLSSKNQFMPNVDYEQSVYVDWTTSPVKIDDFPRYFLSEKVTIYVMGRFDYIDGNGVQHWTTFCQFLHPPGGWGACPKYNDSDKNE
jgi:hypothetical protein